jgi:alpha-1,2-glucosyltransferase
MEAAFRQPKLVARVVSPYVPVGVAFLAFLVWNAGIVLGDKTMHVAVLHIPQIYYFAAFAGCLMVPHIIDAPIVRQTCRTLFGSLR